MSEQVGAGHVPAGQRPLWQSFATLQCLPLAHLPQSPPQSVSVSLPFLTRSEQLGVWQMFETQTPLAQSLAPPHTCPAAHLFGQPPPQSVSVSPPFFTMSVHDAFWQVGGIPLQTPLWQSAAPAQACPPMHLGQSDPQSTSVSV